MKIRGENLKIDKYEHLPSFDMERIDVLIKLGKDLNENVLAQMLNLHFEASAQIIEESQLAFANKNYILLAQLAHKFKSNSGQLGLIKLHAMCNDLENLIRVQNGTEIQILELLTAVTNENVKTIQRLHEQQGSSL